MNCFATGCTVAAFAFLSVISAPVAATAQERLCDTQYEDCRAPLLELIRRETAGIDVALWFIEDARYANELIKRHQAGVPVRVLVDLRANNSKRLNETILAQLRDGGIPMRHKFGGGDILHFKMMLFHGQNIVEFSKANFTDASFVPIIPNVNYFDEAVFFTDDDRITNSFRRRFDDLWIDTTAYADYANVVGPLVRSYPEYPIHASMNFPPVQNFSSRSVSRYDREMQAIDAIVYRVTDHRQADGMIRAVQRGAQVRLITEPTEYRNATRVWHAKHLDRMYMGGVTIRHRQHQGLMHQASVVMHGLGEVIFGSSNWTTTSAIWQDEHNFFYEPSLGKPWFFQWFADQFERKWTDEVNYGPFTPLPPDAPVNAAPSNGASGAGTSVTLKWDGGPWAHLYDIHFGTTPDPPLLASNRELGSPLAGQMETFTVTNLQPGTTYYWRIVGRTWAQLTKTGPVWSFTTAGTAPDSQTGPAPTTPYGGTAAAVPGTFQAENFDESGTAPAYYDTTAGNKASAYRATDVDIEATADSSGAFNVGWVKAGEWLKYTVNVSAGGTYTLETRVAAYGTGGRFRVEVDGVDATGPISVPNTGGWQVWQTIRTSIALTAGTRVLRVVFDTAGTGGSVGNFNWFRLTGTSTGTTEEPATKSQAYGGTPPELPGVVQAENFDEGTQGTTYYDVSAGNSGGVYRSTDVDITATTDTSGNGYGLGWARVGEWLKYSVNVTETRQYTVDIRLANVGNGGAFRMEIDGVDVTGSINVPNTGGWDTWQTVSVPMALTQGKHVLRLVMVASNVENSSVGNFEYFRFR